MTMQLQELIDTLTSLLPVAGPTADTGVQSAYLRAAVEFKYPKHGYKAYNDDDEPKRGRIFSVQIENEPRDAQPSTQSRVAGSISL